MSNSSHNSPSAKTVVSAHDNGCESCRHSRRPDGGHCYMFKDEPRVCFQHTYDRSLVESVIDGDRAKAADLARLYDNE